ncbi:MAG: 50S ribosomal protein L9 [Lachnospiraceae bacterium]|nr:50S ribosomal protein L9 [Lachnospiraceae bacterium]
MKVILTEDVKSLGKKGEVVEVSDGYARNFILSKKKGVEATAANMNNLKLKKANDERIAKEQFEEAKAFAAELATKEVKLSIRFGEGGKSFGSVTSKEIAAAAEEQLGLSLDKKKIVLKEPLKTAGEHRVAIKLHPEVTAELKVTITEEQ